MVLSDVEIWAEIAAERLVFNPPISERERVGSSSVDLLLHGDLVVLPAQTNPGDAKDIDPSAPGFNAMDIVRSMGEAKTISDDAPYAMQPNQLVIGKTLEYIKLPAHIAARIEGKSSLARLGLSVHVTAPTVHAGFEGALYLEMNNIGPYGVILRKGMEIAQLILEHTGLPPSSSYEGRYRRQQ